MNKKLSELLKTITLNGKVWVAYSGGLDSTVLLHLAVRYAEENNVPCEAIHVHHGLNKKADEWVLHCERACQEFNVPLTVERVSVKNSGKGVEAAARDARYQAFAECMSDTDVLLTAHHQDDQIETLFLRLFRGAGVKGLGAMSAVRSLKKGQLLRPLIHSSRDALLQYAEEKQLNWIDDESNFEMHFDRNFIRHELIPKIKTRREGVEKSLLRTIQNCQEADELLNDLAVIDFQTCALKKNEFSVVRLKILSTTRQYNLLRYWLKHNNIAVPDRIKLKTIITDALYSKHEARPIVHWPGGEVRRIRDRLFCVMKQKETENE